MTNNKSSATREAGLLFAWSVFVLVEGTIRMVSNSKPDAEVDYFAATDSNGNTTVPVAALLAAAVAEVLFGVLGCCLGVGSLLYAYKCPKTTVAFLMAQAILGWFVFVTFVLAQPILATIAVDAPTELSSVAERRPFIILGYLKVGQINKTATPSTSLSASASTNMYLDMLGSICFCWALLGGQFVMGMRLWAAQSGKPVSTALRACVWSANVIAAAFSTLYVGAMLVQEDFTSSTAPFGLPPYVLWRPAISLVMLAYLIVKGPEVRLKLTKPPVVSTQECKDRDSPLPLSMSSPKFEDKMVFADNGNRPLSTVSSHVVPKKPPRPKDIPFELESVKRHEAAKEAAKEQQRQQLEKEEQELKAKAAFKAKPVPKTTYTFKEVVPKATPLVDPFAPKPPVLDRKEFDENDKAEQEIQEAKKEPVHATPSKSPVRFTAASAERLSRRPSPQAPPFPAPPSFPPKNAVKAAKFTGETVERLYQLPQFFSHHDMNNGEGSFQFQARPAPISTHKPPPPLEHPHTPTTPEEIKLATSIRPEKRLAVAEASHQKADQLILQRSNHLAQILSLRDEAYRKKHEEERRREQEERNRLLSTLSPHVVPKKPSSLKEVPFQLASVKRHEAAKEAAKEQQRQQLEKEEQELKAKAAFKAKPVPETTYTFKEVVPKAAPLVDPISPELVSKQRALDRKEFDEYAKEEVDATPSKSPVRFTAASAERLSRRPSPSPLAPPSPPPPKSTAKFTAETVLRLYQLNDQVSSPPDVAPQKNKTGSTTVFTAESAKRLMHQPTEAWKAAHSSAVKDVPPPKATDVLFTAESADRLMHQPTESWKAAHCSPPSG